MAKKEHVCKTNEHAGSLALKYDFFKWESLWDANKGLGRDDPNVLYKARIGGDVVQVPEKKQKKESCDAAVSPGKTHVFQVPTCKLFLRLQILNEGFEPVKKAEYELAFDDNGQLNLGSKAGKDGKTIKLNVDGKELPLKGTTDDKGIIEHQIPIRLETATLAIRVKAEDTDSAKKSGSGGKKGDEKKDPKPVRGDVPIKWVLKIGKLNPIKERAPTSDCISGIQQRLNNLALNSGPIDGILGPNTKAAIGAFQEVYQISVPKGHEGEPNGVTQDKLYDVHDTDKDVKPPAPKKKGS